MTRIAFALIAAALLTACGADGEPTHPERRPTPGVTVDLSGTAEIGVTGGS